jgi:glycosyltransferase involved in cell wall biosynthesis
MNHPAVSVIVPSYNAARTILGCLESLARQSTPEPFEIVVVDSSSDGTAQLVAQRFPKVRLYTFADRKFPGDARNLAVARARGELLAFIDADCIADPDWIAQIVRAHRAPDPAIGGVVDNANPRSYVGWASYFCEFSQWIPRSAPRRMTEIPTCCLSLKRWAFETYGPFREGTYCSDTAFQWKLGRAGHPPVLLPSIRVSHVNRDRLGSFLGHEPYHGWAFAVVRTSERRLTRRCRLSLVALSPLLPALLYLRMARRVLKNGRYVKEFLVTSPLILLGLIGWSFGEVLGYLSTSGE